MPTPADLRRDVTHLTDLAERDLATIWAQVTTAAEAAEALNDILPALIQQYGEAAALLAVEWYDDLREQIGVPGRFRAIAADIPDVGAQSLTAWAAREATDLTTMQALILGGTQRRIANFSRRSVIDSTFADPRAEGWMRTGIGECDFCRMLISRGAVYTEKTVRFGAHDHDQCQAAPSWGRPSDVFDVDEYRRSTGRRSDRARAADNARAREWIADNL